MNDQHRDQELLDELGRELHHRVDRLHDAPIDLTSVQGRARGIRRRRTATAVVATAAAVALVVPVAIMAGHRLGNTPPPVASSGPTGITTGPAPSTVTAAPAHPKAPLDVDGLETGRPPATGYVLGKTLHLGGGGTAHLDVSARVDGFAVLDDGTTVVRTRDDQGHSQVEVIDSGENPHGPYAVGEGFAVDRTTSVPTTGTSSAAAWVTRDGQVQAWPTGASAPVDVAGKVPGTGFQIDGMVGSCTTADPCLVLVRTTDQSTGEVQDWVASSDGGLRRADPAGRLQVVNDLNQLGEVVGLTRITDTSACSAIATATARGFETCDHKLTTFSPDGQSIAGVLPQSDGPGSSDVAAYSADGQLLFDHRSDIKTQAFVATMSWEDDEHLLGTVFQAGQWYVVRFGTDGSMEIAAGPVPGDMASSPIVLTGGH